MADGLWRILVIDDDPDCLQLVSTFLTRDLHAEVITAATQEEAWNHVITQDIHCVVCDCNMPEGDGQTFMKRVRDLKPEVPRLLISGYVSGKDLQEAVVSQLVHGYVQKRDISGALATTIEQLLIPAA